MKNWSTKRKILLGIVIMFLAGQIFQPLKNQGNPSGPKDITKVIHTPDSVLALLKNSCYDCHSNHTNYPWYDHITPVNWWVASHITEGKQELNFSAFGEYDRNQQMQLLEGTGETVKMGKMPLESYLITHGEAKLSEAEKQIIYNWTRDAMEKISLR